MAFIHRKASKVRIVCFFVGARLQEAFPKIHFSFHPVRIYLFIKLISRLLDYTCLLCLYPGISLVKTSLEFIPLTHKWLTYNAWQSVVIYSCWSSYFISSSLSAQTILLDRHKTDRSISHFHPQFLQSTSTQVSLDLLLLRQANMGQKRPMLLF